MKGIYEWLGKHVQARYGTILFGILVIIEGFFIMPISTLLAFYSLQNREKAFLYATIATLMSGVGAMVGYAIGLLAWQAGGKELIYYFTSPESFENLVSRFTNYQAWTTFFVALTPAPFKLITLTAGFLRLPIIPFLAFSIAARGLRFFGIAGSIYIWGERVQYYINEYFYYVLGCILILFFLFWYLVH
jgi:membrane protein YqaA with SNARE-associated domain